MEPMSNEEIERQNWAESNEFFINQLNEILRSSDTSSTNKDDPEFSTTGPLIPLNPSS